MESIQSVIDALAERFDRSVTLDSPEGDLLAYNLHHQYADPARLEAVLNRHTGRDVMIWERNVEPGHRSVLLPGNEPLGLNPRLRVLIGRPQRPLAYLWLLESGRPFTREEQRDVAHAAHTIQTLLDTTREQGTGKAQTDDLLELIATGQENLDNLESLIQSLVYEKPYERLLLVAVVNAPTSGGQPASMSRTRSTALRRALSESSRPLARAVSASHGLVILGDVVRTDQIDHRLQDALNAQNNSKSTFFSGRVILDPASGPRSLATALEEARLWACLTAIDPTLPPHLSRSAAPIYRRLESKAPPLPVTAIGDLQHDLLLTLETYLDFGGDVAQVAKHLHLHRATVYYRLQRVQEISRVDLSNGLVRTELHLALKQQRLSDAAKFASQLKSPIHPIGRPVIEEKSCDNNFISCRIAASKNMGDIAVDEFRCCISLPIKNID